MPLVRAQSDVVTARNIAKQCGILSKGGIVMEGSEFRRLTLDQMDRLVPNLEVLARSSPTDKQLLVSRYADKISRRRIVKSPRR